MFYKFAIASLNPWFMLCLETLFPQTTLLILYSPLPPPETNTEHVRSQVEIIELFISHGHFNKRNKKFSDADFDFIPTIAES